LAFFTRSAGVTPFSIKAVTLAASATVLPSRGGQVIDTRHPRPFKLLIAEDSLSRHAHGCVGLAAAGGELERTLCASVVHILFGVADELRLIIAEGRE
jgi:hypothetical protein